LLNPSGCNTIASPASIPEENLVPTKQDFAATSTSVPETISETDELPERIANDLEVVFWHPWSGEMANLIQELAEEYNRKNAWGTKIVTAPHADERMLIQDLEIAGEENTLPDVIAAPDDYLQLLARNAGTIQELNQYIQSSRWGLTEAVISSYLPVFWNRDIREGMRIGIPAYRSAHFLFFNQTWSHELGFEQPPTRINDFSGQICAAARQNGLTEEKRGTGGWIYSYDGFAILSWLRVFGGGSLMGDQQRINISERANMDAAAYLQDIFFRDCAWIGRLSLPYQYFQNRQAITYSGKMEDIFIQEQVNAANKTEDIWVLIPYPTDSGKPVLLMEGLSYAIITSDDEKALAAWDFIRWLTATENQVKMVETSGTFPLSNAAIEKLTEFRYAHPVWHQTLQYLPLMQSIPVEANWMILQDVLSDVGWKLIQYTTSKEDIPGLFQDAEALIHEIEK